MSMAVNNKLCVPIVAENLEQARHDLQKAQKLADIIELRLDYFKNPDETDLENFIQAGRKPVILTCRTVSYGGEYKHSEARRAALFKAAIDQQYDYIDVEYDSQFVDSILDYSRGTRVILSYHNFQETPSLRVLNSVYEKIMRRKPDLVKIVTYAKRISDNFTLFQFLEDKAGLISFNMGVKGHISRLLAPKYNSLISFASLESTKTSAPGQLTVTEMKQVFNFNEINPHTTVLGVIGSQAEHSQSKYLHNQAFQAEKTDMVYVPFKVEAGEELADFMHYFREFNFKGAAVTIPHKVAIQEYCDELDNTALEIGAVNTLCYTANRISGFNTDYIGAVQALGEKTELSSQKVLVIGAGGAARAVVYGLVQARAKVTIVNRTFRKAKELAEKFDAEVAAFERLPGLMDAQDIIINTTNVGMYPDTNRSVVDKLPRGKLVMDIIYNPLQTRFIELAQAAGCEVVTGEKMLIYQALAQLKIWTGKEPEYHLLEKAFYKYIKSG